MRRRSCLFDFVVLLLISCSAFAQESQLRAASARFRIEGPLERVQLELGTFGTTELLTDLAAGEAREVWLPLSAPGPVGALLPKRVEAGPQTGTLTFLYWGDNASWVDPREGLPKFASRRPLPPGPGRERPSSPWLLALGLSLLGFALHRRPLLALPVVLVGALGIGWLVGGLGGQSARDVIEAREGARQWMRVRVSPGLRELQLAGDLRLSTFGTQLRWSGDLRAGRESWEASAGEHELYTFEPLTASPGQPPTGLGILAAWERGPGGWTSADDWIEGERAPEGRPEGAAPPAWLAAGLPQGVRVVLVWLGGESWMRWVAGS